MWTRLAHLSMLTFGLSGCTGIFEALGGVGADASPDALTEIRREIAFLHEELAARDAILDAQAEALEALTRDAAADVAELAQRLHGVEDAADRQAEEAALRDAVLARQADELAEAQAGLVALRRDLQAEIQALASAQDVRGDLLNLGNMISVLQLRLGAVERDAATQVWVTEQGFARQAQLASLDSSLRADLAAVNVRITGAEQALSAHEQSLADLRGRVDAADAQARLASKEALEAAAAAQARADDALARANDAQARVKGVQVVADGAHALAEGARSVADGAHALAAEAASVAGRAELSAQAAASKAAGVEARLGDVSAAVGAFDAALADVRTEFSWLSERMALLDAELGALSAQPVEIDAALALEVMELWARSDKLAEELAFLNERDQQRQRDLEEVYGLLSELEAAMPAGGENAAAFASLESEISAVAERLDEVVVQVGKLSGQTSALDAGLSAVRTDVLRNQVAIVTLRAAVGAVGRSVRVLDARVDGVEGEADEIWLAVDDLNGRVSLLEGDEALAGTF